MSKVLKIFLILTILSCVFINVCLATEEENTADDVSSSLGSSTSNISAQVTSVDSLSRLPEANLGLNNILNVILISIGVLLILFAIAILIRLKKTSN